MYLLFLLVLRYRKKVCLTKVKQTFSEKNSAFSEILRFYEFLTSRKEFIRSVCIAQKFIFISEKLVIFWVSSSKKSWLGKYIIIKNNFLRKFIFTVFVKFEILWVLILNFWLHLEVDTKEEVKERSFMCTYSLFGFLLTMICLRCSPVRGRSWREFWWGKFCLRKS